MENLMFDDHVAGFQNLTIKPSELLSVSHLAKNPPKYVNRVHRTGKRVVLTRNGMPIAGLVSLDVLAMADELLTIKENGGVSNG